LTEETFQEPETFWKRFWRGLRSLDEAVSRTETDDILDRIDALEKRVHALSSRPVQPSKQ